jgi:hypothetical protein
MNPSYCPHNQRKGILRNVLLSTHFHFFLEELLAFGKRALARCGSSRKASERARPPPMASEEQELEDLKDLFASSPTRESDLPVGAYSRFTVQYDNNLAAKACREEKQLRKGMALAEQQEKIAERARRVQEDRGTIDKIRQLQQQRAESKQAAKREQREMEARWEELRIERQKRFEEQARERVLEFKAMDAKLDKAEAEQDEREREEAKEAKLALQEAAEEMRQKREAHNQALADRARKEKKVRIQKKKAKAKQLAAQREAGRNADLSSMAAKREANQKKHLEQVAAKKKSVIQIRERARREKEQLQQKKAVSAKAERANDYLVEERKKKDLADKKEKASRVYRERYANGAAADFVKQQVETSSLYLVSRAMDQPDPGIHKS